MPTKELIFNTLSDSCADLFYYRRKEDEELSVEGFEQALLQGVITEQDLIDEFTNQVNDWARDVRKKEAGG